MKMRKILSGVVAGAIAASAMVMSVGAASVTRNAYDVGSYKVVTFEGTVDFSDLTFSNGAQVEVKLKDIDTKWSGVDKNNVRLTSLKVNGSKITRAYDDNGTTKYDGNFTLGQSATISFGAQSGENKIRAGKHGSFLITAEAVVYVDGNPHKDKSNDFNNPGDTNLSFDFTVLDGALVNTNDYREDGTIGLSSVGTGFKLDTTIGKSGSYDKAFNAGNSLGGKTLDRYSLQEQAIMKNATGSLTITFAEGTGDRGYADLKIDWATTLSAVYAKGATSVTIDIPANIVYNANYEEAFRQYESITVRSGDKIANAVFTFTDGVADSAEGDDDTTAAGDDDAAPVEDDDAAADDDATADDDTDADDLTADDDDSVEDDGDDDLATDDDSDDDFVPEDSDDDSATDDGDDDFANETSGDDSTDTDTDATANEGDEGTGGAGSTETDGGNPKTGVAVAVIPALVAAAAVVVARKRK